MELVTIGAVSLLAAVSPGPDFFVVLRNSLVFSRRAGMMTACGVSFALIIHIAYTLVGIGMLISQSPALYSLLTKAGALWLLYIGCKSLYSRTQSNEPTYTKSLQLLSSKQAFMQGFLTNLLNPKCALFFISLFSQFITPETPGALKAAYGLINWSISLCWFLFFSYVITSNKIQRSLFRFQSTIDRIMGIALLFLGLKLLFE